MSEAVVSRVERVRPQSTTVAPRDASLRAVATPMPLPAPVTTATCPLRGVRESMEVVPLVQLNCPGAQEYRALHLMTVCRNALVQTNLRKLRYIHIIPLTGTKLLPRTAGGVLSIPGHTLGAHRAEIHSDSDSALHRFPAVRFPKTRGAIGMKTTLLAIVLAVAFAAAAQVATQPQTQPAAPAGGQAQAPTIKDAAEYN